MKVLVTGGSGFIGRNVKESFLGEKYTLVAPTRAEFDCTSDKSVETFFTKNSFDVVIHSAAKPAHRNATDATNLLYTNSRIIFNMLKYRDSWGKLINMGSGAIYGMDHYRPKMKEEYFGTFIPTDEHGYNKYIFGQLFPSYKNVIDFRIFGIFGKYEDYAIRFISNAICKSLFDLPITLRQNKRFDYLYIDDLMPILDHFILHPHQHSAYNITPDESIELLEAARIVKRVSGSNQEIQIAGEGFGLEYSGDNSRLRKELPGVKFTPPEEAINTLFNWYKSNKASLKKEVLLTDK